MEAVRSKWRCVVRGGGWSMVTRIRLPYCGWLATGSCDKRDMASSIALWTRSIQIWDYGKSKNRLAVVSEWKSRINYSKL